jgi:hypothetical protein
LNKEISISFISSTQVNLDIDNNIINSLSEGQSLIIGDIKILIKDISYSSLDNSTNSVLLEITPFSSCSNDGNCILWQGQEISFKNNKILISYIGQKEQGFPEVVIFSVNGKMLKSLREGDSIVYENIVISDLNLFYNSEDSGLSKVQFVVNEKKGIFSDIGSFFKKLFGRN